MSKRNAGSRIQSFIVQTFPAAKKRLVSEDAPLLESGVIDSLGVLDVVAFLEQSFMIKVSDDELSPENFASVASLATFVEKKQAQLGVPAE